MKKTILKAAIAATVAFATISVSSVIAMAKDMTYEYDIVNQKQYVNGVESTDKFFDDTSATSNTQASSFTEGTFQLSNGTTVTANKGRKMENSTAISFKTTSYGSDAEITILYCTKGTDTQANIKLDDSNLTMADNTSVTKYTGSLASGDHSITKGNKNQAIVFYVKVVDHVSDLAKDYTLSGKTNLSGETFTLGDYSVTTNADGSWKLTETSDSSPYVAGTSLEVSLNGYTAEPSTVTIKAVDGSDTEFKVDDIEFTPIPFTAIPESKEYSGTEIAKGLPYFKSNHAEDTYAPEIKYNDGKGFSFILKDTATVTIDGRSNNDEKTATFTLSGQDVSRTKDVPAMTKDDNGNKIYNKYVFESIPAGEITFTVAGTASYVKSINIEYTNKTMADNKVKMGDDYAIASKPSTFVIHLVTEDELAYDNLVLDGTTVSTDTVYSAVQLPDGSEITAKDLGAKALYAIEVTSTDGSVTPKTALVWKNA